MAKNRIGEVYPYLRTRDAKAAIEFYKQAFGAVEDFRLSEPTGRIGHAELKFGEATVMVSDEYPEYGVHGPTDSVPTGTSIHLHVANVDAMTEQAVAAGARLIMEPKDQFYGERSSKVLDPFGTNGCSDPTSRMSRVKKCSGDSMRCLAAPTRSSQRKLCCKRAATLAVRRLPMNHCSYIAALSSSGRTHTLRNRVGLP